MVEEILSSVMTDSKSIVHCNRDLSYLNRMAVVTRKIPNSQRLCRRPPKDKQKEVFMRNHEIIKELTKANKSNRTVLISLKAKQLHLAHLRPSVNDLIFDQNTGYIRI